MFKFYFYKFFGLGVKSYIRFPELTPVNTEPDVFIRLNNAESINQSLDERTPKSFDIPFFCDNELIFRVIDGNEIIVNLKTSIKQNTLRSLILSQGMGIILHQRGFLVLHGSAVQMDDGAVAFLGRCGDGKSTITAALNNKGYSIISDDVLPVKLDENNIPLLLPSFPTIKLYNDVIEYLNEDYRNYDKIHPEIEKYLYKTKNMVKLDFTQFNTIYILDKAGKNEIRLLKPQEKLISLIKNTYPKSMFGPIEKTQNLKQCTTLLKNVEIKQLNVTHSFKKLGQLIEIVENDIFDK